MKPTEHPVRRPFPEALAQRLEARFGKRLSRAESIRAHHGHDESHFPDAAPDAVVFVHSTDEVAEVVRACGEFDVPLIPFGVGSSLEGHILATRGGLCISAARLCQQLRQHALQTGHVAACQSGSVQAHGLVKKTELALTLQKTRQRVNICICGACASYGCPSSGTLNLLICARRISQ